MYVKITNGSVDQYPYTIGQLRRDNPQTSFPKTIPAEVLEDYSVYSVITQAVPYYNNRTQKLSTADKPVLLEGKWTLVVSVVDKTEEEIAQYDKNNAEANRTKRDTLLAETDYLALSDTTLTTEMAEYRQALRDITSHANWPNLEEADWPVKPV